MVSKEKPYVLLVAELIYSEICKIKKLNPDFSNINAIEAFIGSDIYKDISSGKFHDVLLKRLEKDNFFIIKTKKKIPKETIRLLQIKRFNNQTINSISKFILYQKSLPIEISQRAFDHLWRMCESYELWCKETKQNNLVVLNITD